MCLGDAGITAERKPTRTGIERRSDGYLLNGTCIYMFIYLTM